MKKEDVKFNFKIFNNLIFEIIKTYFHKGIIDYLNIFYFNQNNYKTELLKFAYYIAIKNIKKAEKYLADLFLISSVFNNLEHAFFCLFLAKYYELLNHNLTAFKILYSKLNTKISIEYSLARDYALIKNALLIKRTEEIKDITISYRNTLIKTQNMKALSKLEQFVILNKILTSSYNEIINLERDIINSDYKNFCKLFKSIIYYRDNQYDLALRKFPKLEKNEITASLFAIGILELNEAMEHAIDLAKNTTIDFPLFDAFKEYLSLKEKAINKNITNDEFYEKVKLKYFERLEVENYYFLRYIKRSLILYFNKIKNYKKVSEVVNLYNISKMKLCFW